jgi:hypothetical protein
LLTRAHPSPGTSPRSQKAEQSRKRKSLKQRAMKRSQKQKLREKEKGDLIDVE